MRLFNLVPGILTKPEPKRVEIKTIFFKPHTLVLLDSNSPRCKWSESGKLQKGESDWTGVTQSGFFTRVGCVLVEHQVGVQKGRVRPRRNECVEPAVLYINGRLYKFSVVLLCKYILSSLDDDFFVFRFACARTYTHQLQGGSNNCDLSPPLTKK